MTHPLAFVSLEDVQDTVPAPAESSDPFELLARKELIIGVNIRGLPIDEIVRQGMAITLNIDLGLD